MKTVLTIILGSAIFFLSDMQCARAQKKDICKCYFDRKLHINVYTEVDQMPEFPGGKIALLRFVQQHYKIDTLNSASASILYSFIVNSAGKIKDARIYNKNVQDYTTSDREALRVLTLMPRWKPGKCKRKSVPVLALLPIRF